MNWWKSRHANFKKFPLFKWFSHNVIIKLVSLISDYDGPVVCTDCLENGTSYSKHCIYLPHDIAPPSGLEYQQTHQTSTFTSHNIEPHCNGTPNGVRKDSQTPIFPTNHNRVTISPLSHHYSNRKGENGHRFIRLCFRHKFKTTHSCTVNHYSCHRRAKTCLTSLPF